MTGEELRAAVDNAKPGSAMYYLQAAEKSLEFMIASVCPPHIPAARLKRAIAKLWLGHGLGEERHADLMRAGGIPDTTTVRIVNEAACRGCGAMNDEGVKVCYRCGEKP